MEISSQDYKEVARKVRERVKKELPHIQELLGAVENGGDNMALLPQVIHTLAVVYPEKSYRFLEWAFTLYDDICKVGKTDVMDHDLWKALKNYYGVIKKLYTQEQDEYIRQIAYYRSRIQEKQLEDESINVDEMLEEESKYFQHVVCDISSSIKSYYYILVIGYTPTQKQIQAMRSMLHIGKELLTEIAERHKKTLETTNSILD